MHELALATDLCRQVLEVAREHRASRVDIVEIEVGAFQHVVPEMLLTAFAAVSEGTPAEGAELKIVQQRPAARCRACGGDFQPDADDFLCPHCGQADADISAGRDIILKSLTCQAPEGAALP